MNSSRLPADQLVQRAETLAAAGASAQARELYALALEQEPDNAAAKAGMAALAKRSAAFDALMARYNKGDLDAVVREGETLTRDYPGSAFLFSLIASAHGGLKQPEEALVWLDRALALRPDIAEAHNNRGKTLSELGRDDEAIAAFRRAVALKPQHADACYSLGVALTGRGQADEAAQCFRAALAARPDFTEAYIHLGLVYRDAGRQEEAIACFARAVQIKPDSTGGYIQLASSLQKLHHYPQAIAALSRVRELEPDLADVHGQLLYLMALICDWAGLAREAAAIPELGIKGKPLRPFVMLPLEDAPARHLARARHYAHEHYGKIAASPAAPARHEKIRLGYFSADFHDHAVMQVLPRLLELHDRSRFEVHGFSLGPHSVDPMRQRAEKAVDVFHDMRALNDDEVAGKARDLGIDIAVNLMGYTEGGRTGIFARRAAPLQISFLGYMGTLGAGFMDYLIADAVAIPDDQRAHYAEKIIRMPGSFMPVDDSRAKVENLTRSAMGLPEQGFVFASFNNSYKFAPESFDIWMRLLAAVEGSVLWLRPSNLWADANLKREAEKRGIDPKRLIFATRVAMDVHLGRQGLADLFLDTFAYNAHSSAIDALWGGLPVLTLAGQGMPARVAASLLHAVGLPELVAQTPDEYERVALALARGPARLAAIRARLGRPGLPLFDAPAHARAMERAYETALERHRSGQAPADFTVEEGA